MFDAGSIQKFSSTSRRDWLEWSGMSLADVIDEDNPTAKLDAVGFLRAPQGAVSDFKFLYAEVLVVTSGRCALRSGDRLVIAAAGEVLYVPAGTAGTIEVLAPLELVYVAVSPFGKLTPEIKQALLSAAV
jgi:ethanolamine utilization protein EutQ (cupin superfamily)